MGTAPALAADAIPPLPQDIGSFCQYVWQTDPFTDSAGGTFEREIECLFAAGITTGGPGGLSADRYGPELVVNRGAMASFIARMMDTADELDTGDAVRPLLAYDGTPAFTDIGPTNPHFQAVHRLEQAGIVQGGPGGRPATQYAPDLPVNRAQMASFVARAIDFMQGAPLRTDNDYYADDEAFPVHEPNINGITAARIAAGDGKQSFRPAASITRGQMSAFLVRALAVLEQQFSITLLPPDSEDLRDEMTVEGAREHLEALQAIADANGDRRASGTPGYDESVAYVVDTLTDAGYEPEVQEFDFDYFEELAPARLTASGTALNTTTYTYSGSTDKGAGQTVSGPIVPVDVLEPPGATPSSSNSGCEAADFAGFPAGAVALLQRGTCTFGVKAANAQAAGASAAIIYNEGQAGRQELFQGTLGGSSTLPVVGLSYQDGSALVRAFRAGSKPQAEVYTKTVSEVRPTYNVIAQTPGGDPDNVVMVGAHLDSVPAGPGINDNGTGSAGVLELALALADEEPNNAVRFAWWGAEELGLLGSEHYVAELTEEEVAQIALYLNFDMIGSPNYVRFVYDGDGSAADAGPQGSAAIEYVFSDFFESQGLASEPTEFSGRSDYGPFIAEGIDIPSGGLFTGAEGVKTEEQEAVYGGEAGVAYDPNYHEAGDTIENVDFEVLDQNLDAIGHAVKVFGGSTGGFYDLAGENRTEGPGTSAGDGGSQGGLHDHDHGRLEA